MLVLPASETPNRGHAWQLSWELLAETPLYVLAGHWVQTEAALAPTTVLQVPAAHFWQASELDAEACREYVPAGQGTHPVTLGEE